MPDIKYRYALSDADDLIRIEDAAQKTEYKCLVCHKPLIARKGKVNAHHFAHKHDQEGESCPSNCYLRELAMAAVVSLYRDSKLKFSYGRTTTCHRDCPAGFANKCTSSGEFSDYVSNYYSSPIRKSDDLTGDFLEFKRKNGANGSLYIHFCRKPDRINLGPTDKAIYISPKKEEFIDTLYETGTISETCIELPVGIVEFCGFKKTQDGECLKLYRKRLYYFGIDECGRIKRCNDWDCSSKIPNDVVFCIISDRNVFKWVKYDGKIPIDKKNIDTSLIPSNIRYRMYP